MCVTLQFPDDVFLLQFLRVCKFNITEAFHKFENYFMEKTEHPEFFNLNSKNYEKMILLFETGFCCPLSDRDVEGRKILLFSIRKWNPEIYTTMDAIRLVNYVVCIMLEEEETQISGISFIHDLEGLTTNHLTSPLDLKKFLKFNMSGGVARQKDVFVISLPTFAAFLYEILSKCLKEKLVKRLFVLKSDGCLKDHIVSSILPEKFGGTKSQAVMMQEFLVLEEQKREKVLKYWKFNCDWSHLNDKKEREEGVGSFRTIEID
jgi:alpha-tocopherol transfer protein